jgi:hypothetical protein
MIQDGVEASTRTAAEIASTYHTSLLTAHFVLMHPVCFLCYISDEERKNI